MQSDEMNITKIRSEINYPYHTIKITQSRIDKGLLAVPRSLSRLFPEENRDINIILDASEKPQKKGYSSYRSRTRESRIGGLSSWFSDNNVVNGDEIILQCIDRKTNLYRLILEKNFLEETRTIQTFMDNSGKEDEVYQNLSQISRHTNVGQKSVIIREYKRLVNTIHYERRPMSKQSERLQRQTAPPNIRVLLKEIFNGHCQVCDFTFLTLNNQPYFEIHHINPDTGHHPKNLILVCANCHRQFEYSHVKQFFNNDDWLIRVRFNNTEFPVNLKNLMRPSYDFKIIHS